ncbi:putative splicing factor 3b subunit 1 [Carpediemonas membranifera]|uniref:Putative splicing factor 3b subunit 1 n=1 Tax=Carpediemonas membranifera TaxID=201153 RepID=A0A8J6APD6_9EUKA|nr:putative splicing factor 3b subunit 1 [Carpediemonas membranifera]|eukprot:KAG9389791.1 putative splicing factor 3b subunit 1 [Carpediemonas membranifera]
MPPGDPNELEMPELEISLGEDTPELTPTDRLVFYDLMERIIEAEEQSEAGFIPAALHQERHMMRLVIRYLNGDSSQRKTAFNNLTSRGHGRPDPATVIRYLCAYMTAPALPPSARYFVCRLLDALVPLIDTSAMSRDDLKVLVRQLVRVLSPMLLADTFVERTQGRQTISALTHVVGAPAIIASVRSHVASPNQLLRNAVASLLAVVATTLGLDSMLPLINALCCSKSSPRDPEPEPGAPPAWYCRRLCGLRAVQQVCIMGGTSIAPSAAGLALCAIGVPLTTDLEALEELPDDSNFLIAFEGIQSISRLAAIACAALARGVFPYAGATLAPLMPLLVPLLDARSFRGSLSLLTAAGYITALAPDLGLFAAHLNLLLPRIQLAERSDDAEIKAAALTVLRQITKHRALATPPDDDADRAVWDAVQARMRERLVPVFAGLCLNRLLLDWPNFHAAVDVGAALATVAVCDMTQILAQMLATAVDIDHMEPTRRMVCKVLAAIFNQHGGYFVEEGSAHPHHRTAIVVNLVRAVELQVTDDTEPVMSALEAALKALPGPKDDLFDLALSRLSLHLSGVTETNPHVKVRVTQALARIAPLIAQSADGRVKLGTVFISLYTQMQTEDYPEALSAVLEGMAAIIVALDGPPDLGEASVALSDVVCNTTAVLKNRNEHVEEAAIHLVDQLARTAGRGDGTEVAPAEWMRICFAMLDMFRAPSKNVRRACIATFGRVAQVIGPQDVLAALLNNLRVQERQQKVCSTIAIAVIASDCGPFTVLPYLMNEYRVPDGSVQTGALKAISFLFEYMGSEGSEYVPFVVDLLTDALTSRSAIHRQTACTCVKHIALNCGKDHQDAVTHLLNHVWPNVLEPTPHLLQAALDAVEACRLSLGSPLTLAYMLAGLYHPARRIRELYWQLYNAMVVGDVDGLTAAYPDAGGRYSRPELDYML